MKISIFLQKDKSKTVNSKDPAAEMKGVPVRITSFHGAVRSHGAEAVVIITPRSFRGLVASAGEMKLYLSPRAKFRMIEPDAPMSETTA